MHRLNNPWTTCIHLVFLLGTLAYTHAQTEAKVNLATLPFLIPNVGLEASLGDKQSFQLDVLGSFWDKQPLLDDTPFHVNQVFFEYRWYQQSDTQKWFIGPHIGFGMFTLQKPDPKNLAMGSPDVGFLSGFRRLSLLTKRFDFKKIAKK